MHYSSARILRVTLSSCLLAALAACGGGVTIKQNSFDNTSTTAASTNAASTMNSSTASQWLQSSMTLTWAPPLENVDGSTLSDLAGYKIYSGSSAHKLDVRATVHNPGLAALVLDDLKSDEVYFAITAFNRKGVESARSAVVYRPVS
jgi:hypothetical protein